MADMAQMAHLRFLSVVSLSLTSNNEISLPPIIPENNIAPIVHYLNDVLKTNETMAKIFEKQKFLNSKRQSTNIRCIRTKSSFKEKSEFEVT